MNGSSRWGLDLSPLRVSSGYRRLFIYGAVGNVASQAAYITLIYQLKTLTNSALEVGALGLVEMIPLVFFGLYGGVIADHFDRRRVMVFTEVGMFVAAAGLWLNARSSHPSVAVIYLVAAAFASLNGLQSPSLNAMTQQLVPHELQRQAATLSMIRSTGTSILGPAIGGLAAVTVGPAVVYGVNALSFGLTIFLLVGLRAPVLARGEGRPNMAALAFGARYARSRPDILGTYLIDLVAMTFAFPYALLPFLAAHFHASYALGLLYASLPIGAFLATVTSRWTSKVHHYGRAVAFAAAAWGVGIALFGVAGTLAVAVVGLIIAGAADAVSGIFRSTMWNESIPLEVRGRMAGLEMLSYSVGPTAGQFRAGAMAAATSLRISLVAGGLACTGVCLLLPAALRSLWSFDSRTNENVSAVKASRAHEQFD